MVGRLLLRFFSHRCYCTHMMERRMTRSQLKSRLEKDASVQDLASLLTMLVPRQQIIELIVACKKKQLEVILFQKFDWLLEIVQDQCLGRTQARRV